MLKNKSGFVGIGAYAGNQLLPFYKDGYPCLFVNTATTDLDSLTEVDDQYKYQIPGGEGCNKDRIPHSIRLQSHMSYVHLKSLQHHKQRSLFVMKYCIICCT